MELESVVERKVANAEAIVEASATVKFAGQQMGFVAKAGYNSEKYLHQTF